MFVLENLGDDGGNYAVPGYTRKVVNCRERPVKWWHLEGYVEGKLTFAQQKIKQ